jgi:serine/threonine-protein kinase RsbT
VRITSDADLVPARAEARALAERLGFTRTDATLIATAISEIARNIIVHVGEGEIVMRPISEQARHGLLVVARDEGVGIPDVRAVLEDGYASRGGLGLGLPGARRLMDDFRIDSERDKGTTVTMTKWRVRDELELIRKRRQHTNSRLDGSDVP